jgi:methylated-DNA-[protein]-cysteine S-methyltransferase
MGPPEHRRLVPTVTVLPMLTTMTVRSPVGPLRLYADADQLVWLALPGRFGPRGPAVSIAPAQASPVLVRTATQLAEYFAGERRVFELPLAPPGTAFQAQVWRALLRIPFGDTRSYGELARSIRRPSASRAVGAANGSNPIAIIVPCHRVIGTSGALTGYGGGLDMKRWLLAHERADIAPGADAGSRARAQAAPRARRAAR